MTTTYQQKKQICCLCSTENDCTLISNTDSDGSSDLDLRPPPEERNTMEAWLQECSSCRYVAVNLDRSSGNAKAVVESEPYQSLIADQNIPELAKRFALCSLLMMEVNKELAAIALLRAAWVCDDEDLEELACFYRTRCSEILCNMMPFEDDAEKATIATTLVDVLRRSAQFDRAAKLAGQLLRFKAVNRSQVMMAVVRYQQNLLDQKSTEMKTVEDALNSQAPE